MNFDKVIKEKLYTKADIIGSGSFGVVWKCIDNECGREFALKQIKIELNVLKAINNEISILKKIVNHPRLVIFYGTQVEGNKILIFTEFIKNGSLRDVIKKSGVFNEKQVAKYTKGALEGLEFLHNNQVLHRDIKCRNILLGDDDNVKLTDFGLSKFVDDKSVLESHTFCGTPFFMAPEVISHNYYSSSADIWSLGVTVVEMMTGKPIYHKMSHFQFAQEVTSHREIKIGIPQPSNELLYCLKLMFLKEPSRRPKSRDLLKCKFIMNIDC